MKLAFIAAAALALGVAAPAVAADELPAAGTALVQVFVPAGTDVSALSERYDLAEYKHVEADGRLLIVADTTAAERAALRSRGLRDRRDDRGRRDARVRGGGARRAARGREPRHGVGAGRRAQEPRRRRPAR